MNVLFLEVNVKPEMREKFLELAPDNARHSAEDEPGRLRCDVLQDANNPNLFYYYEVYADAKRSRRTTRRRITTAT